MRRLTLVIGFLALWTSAAFPAPLAPAALRFRASVNPRSVELVCQKADVITDVQTRDEIARRNGLVGRLEELTRLMDQMRAAGYRTGPGGRLTNDLPLRLTYTRTLAFRAQADRRRVVLAARRTDGRLRVVVDSNAARYLRPDNRARIDALSEAWRNRMAADVQRLRTRLDGAAYPWTAGELQAFGSRNRGVLARDVRFDFCARTYALRVATEWRNEVDGPLGDP